MRLFGTSGIRAIADREFIELAFRVGLAIGSVYGKVVVGCDSRTTSEAMKYSLVSGLLTIGARCSVAGLVPTPTLALAGREFDAAAMITASHNPPEYNGIKLLNPDGSAFNRNQREQIEDMVFNEYFPRTPWHEIKNCATYELAIEQHIERILQDFPAKAGLKVVIDCGCGAGSIITPSLLGRMGCETISLNCQPSGFFPHDIEPTADNLHKLMETVKDIGADLGIAHDGDADRMMAVDDIGRFISGDKLLTLFAREAGAKEVVTTIDASMAIDDTCLKITRTPVGDIYVSEELKKGGEFGGEPSGSWVFPQVSLCPDGIYAAARIVAIASRHKLSQLTDNIPDYPIIRSSINNIAAVTPELKQRLLALEPLSVSNNDGIRLNFKDGWVLCRASGTEPKIRLTIEARTEARLRYFYESATGIINSFVEGK